jgi:hypothetical protein
LVQRYEIPLNYQKEFISLRRKYEDICNNHNSNDDECV